MSVVARSPRPDDPGDSPRAIRGVLPPAEAAEFDDEYRRVMREATETQELAPVFAFVRRWRRIAISTADRGAHESVLARAEAMVRGEPVVTEAWPRTRARLGL